MFLFVASLNVPGLFSPHICPVVLLSFRIRIHLMRLMRQHSKLNVFCVSLFSPPDWICLSEHKQITTFFLNLLGNLGFKPTPSTEVCLIFFFPFPCQHDLPCQKRQQGFTLRARWPLAAIVFMTAGNRSTRLFTLATGGGIKKTKQNRRRSTGHEVGRISPLTF